MAFIEYLIIAVIVAGALYILRMLPIDATIKQIIWVVIIIVFAIYTLLFLAGLAGLGPGVKILGR
jgi:hypothetical protein